MMLIIGLLPLYGKVNKMDKESEAHVCIVTLEMKHGGPVE
jgi:hypothetical protein